MKKVIVLATGNAHKVEEFNRLAHKFNMYDIEFVSAKYISKTGMVAVDENSGSFIGNARLKAQALRKEVAKNVSVYILADDSGLCVDALNGEPGVETANYAGLAAPAEKNRAKLLLALEKESDESARKAHFICVLFLISPDGSENIFEGKCFGRISFSESGDLGFGYDSIFIPDGFNKTFAEISGDKKDLLSHRGRAFSALVDFIKK